MKRQTVLRLPPAALVWLALAACARTAGTGLPEGSPYVEGPVASVAHSATASGILVNPPPGSVQSCGISATVDARTRFLRRTASGALEPARVGDLAVGSTVAVYVEGPLTRSCPAQGYASVMVIAAPR